MSRNQLAYLAERLEIEAQYMQRHPDPESTRGIMLEVAADLRRLTDPEASPTAERGEGA